MKRIALLLLGIGSFKAMAQTDTTKVNPFAISAYLETYYAYDFGRPEDHNRPGYIYSFNRHNEVNLNLGFVKAAFDNGNVRGNLALMTGTYANANLASEPGVLRNIFEANAGARISKKHNLWIDAGIFPSHIGFESAVGKDCWNLTRSMLADNSPYYESGAKISWTSANGKWFVGGLFLNGWQTINRPQGFNAPAFGHQLTWKPGINITLNSSSFVGSSSPDSARKMRYFHNFYGIFQIHPKLGITVGFDFGAQQKAKESAAYSTWFSPVLIARYALTNRTNLAARVEYYADADQVMIASGTPGGFKTWGFSLNLDRTLANHLLWRTEGKVYSAEEAVFLYDGKASNTNVALTTSLALSF